MADHGAHPREAETLAALRPTSTTDASPALSLRHLPLLMPAYRQRPEGVPGGPGAGGGGADVHGGSGDPADSDEGA